MNWWSIPKLAIQRPITVIMGSIVLIVLGFISWNRIPLKFLPKVDRPFIGCYIPYPGSSPDQVEQQIAIPVEGEFRTIPGLRSISSTSSPNGCYINMWFNLDTNMTLATAEVRDRIERLKLVLPQEIERIIIQRFSSEAIPVLAIGLFKSEKEEDYAHLIRTSLIPRIRRLEGVADVQLFSPIPEKEVLIEVSQDQLNSLNIPIISLISTLRSSSLNLSLGTLTSEDRKFFVRLKEEYEKISDIADLVINKEGLRLKDIAQVRFGSRGESLRVALDGKGGVVLLIIKESEANAVEVCQSVKDELNSILTEEAFQGTLTKIFFDQSDLINRALHNLFSEGIYGGAMAFVILLLFLHRLIPTIIVAFAIPSSLMIAIIFMYFSDMSLNIITMVSLIISVGMLVDNAIVVVENIIRYQQLGFDRKTSAVRGASEVGLAISASTLTTLVVFLPMYYLEAGRMSVFMKQLGGPLIVALLGSLGIALTLVPLILSISTVDLFPLKNNKIINILGSGQLNPFKKIEHFHILDKVYKVLEFILFAVLRNRLAFLSLLLAFIIFTYLVPLRAVGMKDLIKLDTREVDIKVTLDQNFDPDRTKELFDQLSQKIETLKESIGIKNILLFHSKTGGEIHVYLYTEDDEEYYEKTMCSTEEALNKIRDVLPTQIPGGKLEIKIADTGESGTSREVSLRLTGPNNEILFDYAQMIKSLLENNPLFFDIRLDVEQKKDEIHIDINQWRADEQGVNPIMIAQTIDAALRGAQLPYLKEGSREIPVWLQYKEEDRKNKSNIDNLKVLTTQGALVPLHQVISYSRKPEPAIIKRYNGRNVINFYAKANTENLTLIRNTLSKIISVVDLPEEYTINYGIELEEVQSNLTNFAMTMSMAVILIYIVMSATFESFLLPFVILTTVPLSLVGSTWMLYLTHSHWDMITLIGCVLMAGVIVNNGIVIVDHINFLRKTVTQPFLDIIIQASKDRLRPVLMTALTTILGLVPLALAKTGGSVMFSGLGKALVGGLIFGTILTLIVVPVFYTIIEDIKHGVTSIFFSISTLIKPKPTLTLKE